MHWTLVCFFECQSCGHAVPLVHNSHMSAQRLHPLERFATVRAHEVFPLRVDGLVSVQSAGRDERLSADLAPVRPLPRVRPDVRRQVRAVAEALLAHGAAVGLVFALLAAVVVVVVVAVAVDDVERQRGLLQAAPQAGRRRDEVFHV